MAWKDIQARLRGLFSSRGETTTRRPDGGTSCYRPVTRRNSQEEKIARDKAAEYAAYQPPMAYAHSGCTGMNPPAGGNVPVQSTFTGDPYGFGNGRPQQEYEPGIAAQNMQPGPQMGYEGRPAEVQQANNISYMPGYSADTGSSFTHVEHLMAITSLRSCYEAIECMKNGETLIVTLDVLGSEGERIRCQDMLAGAAFTLQCTVRTLNSIGVVVIAPPGVKILPEQQTRRYEEQNEYSMPVQPYPSEAYSSPRERRASRNAVGWERAEKAGERGINPYTGSMPAAAGDYGVYGGYM